MLYQYYQKHSKSAGVLLTLAASSFLSFNKFPPTSPDPTVEDDKQEVESFTSRSCKREVFFCSILFIFYLFKYFKYFYLFKYLFIQVFIFSMTYITVYKLPKQYTRQPPVFSQF